MLDASEAQPPVSEQRADALLWLAMLLGPLAMGINTIVGYTVAHWVCDVSHKRTDILVSGVDLLLCLVAFSLAIHFRRHFAGADENVPGNGRRYFMANLALLLSVTAALVVIAGSIALFTLHPCD
jgi:hypothetical protein